MALDALKRRTGIGGMSKPRGARAMYGQYTSRSLGTSTIGLGDQTTDASIHPASKATYSYNIPDHQPQ